MDTWLVSNGDLVLSNGAFQTITGPAKIQQDLGIATLTPFGSDRFHTRFGSILESMIGQPINDMTAQTISSEIQRVITNYQAIQVNRLNQAIIQGYASQYNQNDLIKSIDNIHITQSYDSFSVVVTLTTMAGQSVTIGSTVTPSGNAATG